MTKQSQKTSDAQFSHSQKPGHATQGCPIFWIGFHAVENESGKDLANLTINVKWPSGKLTNHKTDSEGLVTIEHAESGNYDLLGSFKNATFIQTCSLEKSVNNSNEKSADPALKRKAPILAKKNSEPAKRPLCFARVKEHKVKKGEGLKSIAKKAGITWEELAYFNFGTTTPDEINTHLYNDIGCTIKDKKGNYHFDDKDDPGIIVVPELFEKKGLPANQTHQIRLKHVKRVVKLELQAVDELGHVAANKSLTLIGEEDLRIKIKTNSKGYWADRKEFNSPVKVQLPNGNLAEWYHQEYRGRDNDSAAGKKYKKNQNIAKIHPLLFRGTMTTIIVPSVKQKTLQRADTLLRRYGRTKILCKSGADISKDSSRESGGNQKTETRGIESKQAGKTIRSLQVATDNLFIAAGWDGDNGPRITGADGLLAYLNSWLNLRHGTTDKTDGRDYYVIAVYGRNIIFYDSGNNEKDRFMFPPNVNLGGAFGAYTLHEAANGRKIFFDMATRSVIVVPMISNQPVPKEMAINIDNLLGSRNDIDRFQKLVQSMGNKVCVLYHLPPSEPYYLGAALNGGTGLLNNYSDNKDISTKVHAINVAVVKNVLFAYKSYLASYVKTIKESKKIKDEDDIRKIGPPRSNFYFPKPAGIQSDSKEWTELYKIQTSKSSLDAWKAIVERLAKLTNSHVEGSAFFRLHFEIVTSTGPETAKAGVVQEVKIEGDLDIGSDGILTKSSKSYVTGIGVNELKVGQTKPFKLIKGVPKNLVIDGSVKVEIDADTGQKKVVVEGGIARMIKGTKVGFGFEGDSDGKRVLKGPQGAYSAWNPRTAEGGFGACIEFEPPKEATQGKPALKGKVCLGIHFKLLSVDTVLAYTCRAVPGFFQRRSIKNLVKQHWNTLLSDERNSLRTIGFTNSFWDKMFMEPIKKFPEQCRKKFHAVNPDVRCAGIALGFRYGNWKTTWESVAKK